MTTLLRLRIRPVIRLAAGVGCVALALAAAAVARAQTALPVIVADFNHDGIPDALVVSASTPTATIAFGSVPYGTFSGTATAVTFPSGCTTLPQGSVVVGDFNNDGFPDIAFFCGNTSGVISGNGDGTFGVPKLLNVGSSQLAVAGDFNQDGKLDLAVIGLGGDSVVTQNIQFLAGRGDGTFAQAVLSNLGQQGYSAPAVADIDGDGYPDIVLLTLASNTQMTAYISVFGNNRDGSFGVAQQGYIIANVSANFLNDPVTAAPSILVGNFFGNDANDLIVPDTGTNPGLYLIKNNSTSGEFSIGNPVKTAIPGLQGAVAGLFSGTGATDLFVANGTSISAYDNDGSGNFATDYGALTVAATSPLFAVVDANGDGYSDIVTAVQPVTGNMQLGVSLTTGSATATSQPVSLAVGTKNVSATWPGNVNLTGATASGQQVVLGAASVTALASSLNPSTVGSAVTFSVSVAPYLPNDAVPTGSVLLSDGTTMLASGTLDGGTFSYTTSALTQATHTITAAYAGDGYFAPSSVVLSQVVNHAPAVAPTLLIATPNAVVYGMALTASMLNASAVDATGAPIPGTFAYSPALGTVLDAGSQTITVTFTPTDLQSFLPATGSVTITVAQATPTLSWATPTSIAFGTPLSAAQLNASATGINATALPGVYTYTPALGTVLSSGTQTLTVSFAPTNSRDYMVATASVQLVVTASVAATVTAPPMAAPGTQPSVTVTLTQPYPVALTGTLAIDFTRSGGVQLTDPALQFAAGGTTYSFPIPANTTTLPPVQLQAGTIAGTITVPLTLTAGDVNVTPANLAPATIVVPPSAPTITGMTLTRSATQLTVVMHGFSNTREVTSAQFHFTAATGAQLGTTDLDLPADLIFNTKWFATTESDAYGSTFTYTQIFNLSDSATTVGSVAATLTNSVGVSNSISAQ